MRYILNSFIININRENMKPESNRAQIALEFLIVYSFVLVVFIILFVLIASQRAVTLTQQEYEQLQLQVQNIAMYIDNAYAAGNGYSATIPIVGSIGSLPYNISISSAGVVKGSITIGKQVINAYGFSNVRNIIVNGTAIAYDNNIGLYQIPIYKGFITLSNSKGQVFIDKKPPDMLSLLRTINIQVPSDVNVAEFNGVNSTIIGNLSNYFWGNNSFTISAWVYITPKTNGPLIGIANTTSENGLNATLISANGLIVYGFLPGFDTLLPYKLHTSGWDMLTLTYNALSYGNVTFFVNGQEAGSMIGKYNTVGRTDYWITNATAKRPAGVNHYFTGMLANVQAYYESLDPEQVMQLYEEGINGAPISDKIVSWWPLNGNTRDYSPNNHNAKSLNLTYGDVEGIQLHALSQGGAASAGLPVGIVSSIGSVNGNSSFEAERTNKTGFAMLFITANSLNFGKGIMNITMYNGNSTMAENLTGWWPLNGNAYDYSGYGNNGTAYGIDWVSPPANQSNFESALFGQKNSVLGRLNITSSGFTISAWIDGNTLSLNRNIFELFDNKTKNHNLLAIGINASGYAYIRWSNIFNTTQFEYSGGSIKPGEWYLITGVWNGNNNTLELYLDGALVAKGPGNGTTQAYMNLYNIGGPYSTINSFDGLISNVQLYNRALSQNQVYGLYNAGIESLPIMNELIGWWPLLGTPNDAIANSTIIFANLTYQNVALIQSGISRSRIAYFNGSAYVNISSSSSITPTNTISMMGWIYLTKPVSAIAQKEGAYGMDVGNDGISPGTFNAYIGDSKATCQNYPYNLSIDKWYFVGFTYNGTNIDTYVNGQPYCSEYTSYSIPSGKTPLAFGGPGDTDGYVNGYLSDMQIYNTALSAEEVQALYENGLPPIKSINITMG
ncbi:MAG: LamG-like jellyroll fold domain-containing protein [Candidatus Micrarchaeia archaeon]